jgi:extracellular elastinolytic metalloproteinase
VTPIRCSACGDFGWVSYEDVLYSGWVDKISWFSETKSDSAFFPLGTTTETYLVTDAAGNTDTCSFTVTVQIASALSDVQPNAQKVNLVPNPASAVLFIELEGFAGETVDVLVTAMDGRTMVSRRENLDQTKQTLELDVSHFASGLYAVTVTSENASQVSRFLKEN